MTPASHSPGNPINDGWLVFGKLLSECFPARPITEPQPTEVHAVRRTRPLSRLWGWLTRPESGSNGAWPCNATDAATRLEILSRGGYSR